MNDTKNIKSIINDKLKEKGLDYIYKYMGNNSLITFDEKDLELILYNFDIINFFNGNVYLKNEISFNFIENENSQALIIVEANDNLNLRELEKILSSIKQCIGKNVNIIYSVSYNSKLSKDLIYLTVINTGMNKSN